MSIDGKPVIPVIGDSIYPIIPRAQEQEIYKDESQWGEICCPAYIFWGLHEEEEGKFCWSGNKDLRHFIELCKKHDMPVIVHISTFCRGEIRAWLQHPAGFSPVRWMYAAISLYTSLT